MIVELSSSITYYYTLDSELLNPQFEYPILYNLDGTPMLGFDKRPIHSIKDGRYGSVLIINSKI